MKDLHNSPPPIKQSDCLAFVRWEDGYTGKIFTGADILPRDEAPVQILDLKTGDSVLAKWSDMKMLVQVKYNQQQKYVKLDDVEGQFDFLQFHGKVIKRFCLPPDASIMYKDATGTEVDAEIFSDLVGQGNVVLTIFSSQEFSDLSLSSASEISDSSFNSSGTLTMDKIPHKRISMMQHQLNRIALIEAVLKAKSGSEAVLQEYQTTETLTDITRRQMVNILVAHMIDSHGNLPTKAVREEYALGIVTLFPSLKDPYTKKGYEHFYDAASSTGYISWRLKTVQRKIRRGSEAPPSSSLNLSSGGPKFQRIVNVDNQLDGDACQEAVSLLNHTTDNSVILQKMRETFQHRQKLVNDPGTSADILSFFPRFLDTKGLVSLE
ncbi:uncharacterized protein LOC133550479 [Nerophis ophidion]|uniref:uncharacterized protein LOC133550479 n=1 Tax=Nerophis ophidion TaxID=159077 RepID=UPI002AE02AE7|nr:uncharacterized protein LOC133550479 [Nerophis ophidion]